MVNYRNLYSLNYRYKMLSGSLLPHYSFKKFAKLLYRSPFSLRCVNYVYYFLRSISPFSIPEQYELPIIKGFLSSGEFVTRDLVKTQHTLIGGQTGGGKSSYIQTIFNSLIFSVPPDYVKLAICDLKDLDFAYLSPLVNYYNKTDQIVEFSKNLYQLLHARKKRLKTSGCTKISEFNQMCSYVGSELMPYIVVLYDEFSSMYNDIPDKDEREDFGRVLGSLVSQGRAFGIFFILASQRPCTETLKGSTKGNFSDRVCFLFKEQINIDIVLGKDCKVTPRMIMEQEYSFFTDINGEYKRLIAPPFNNHFNRTMTSFFLDQGFSFKFLL